MNMERSHSAPDALLPEDFAARVIARVDRVRRRRRITQRVSAAIGASALALAIAFEMRPPVPSSTAPTVASEPASTPQSDWTSTASLDPQQSAPQPMALFFPDADSVTRFAEYYDEPGWHSYDSWWTTGS